MIEEPQIIERTDVTCGPSADEPQIIDDFQMRELPQMIAFASGELSNVTVLKWPSARN